MESMRNACYKCRHRGTVPGDAHSACSHPNSFNIGVKGDSHGIKSGWFLHPFNFDPTWLIACDGFEPKDKESIEEREDD